MDVAAPGPPSAAASAMAAAPAPTAPAPSQELPTPEPEDLDRYLADMAARIRRAQRYPPMARRRGLEGAVTIAVRMHPSGRVQHAAILGSAPRVFARSALQAIERAGPFPKPPTGLPEIIVIPVRYVLD